MALETGTYISDLVITNPTGSDGKDKGDDHLRLLKSTIKTTFPNVTGAVTPTHTELNFSVGVTSGIQAQLNTLTGAKGAIAGQTWTGAHDFTGATMTTATQAPGDNSTKVANTAFVNAVAFSSALPAQINNGGRVITTDGTTASWTNNFVLNDPMYWMGI